MLIEGLIIGVLLYVILEYNGSISTNKFLNDNKDIFIKTKEKDYDFYLKAKYGDAVDIQSIYNARLRNGMLVMFLMILFFIADLSYIKVIITFIAAYGVFKLPYFQIKRYYKAHLSQIDMMLPYYLKSLEILVQHYTVPVALGKSVNEAPEIFRNGLLELLEKINAGDSSINPYMDFAKEYPVRDSMRMMRLLYRLGLGEQEKKHQQLVSFSKSVSNLQAKAREMKYQARLGTMERKTLIMMVVTGGCSLVLLLISIFILVSTV